MPLDRAKILKWLDDYQKIVRRYDDNWKFFLANCHVQLGNFTEARELYEKSCLAAFDPRSLWKSTAQPHWLVDICILAARSDLYPDVIRELNLYKEDYHGNSIVALYSYCVMELLVPSGYDINEYIRGLLRREKVKYGVTLGQALQAIVDRDQNGFKEGLTAVLNVHEGMAKRGGLRATAEGLLCMPAMSLAFTAQRYRIKVEIENDYFSQGYLDFINNLTTD
jgi:hypothetical protein